MKTIISLIVILLATAVLAVTPHAPQLINYQGRLTDNVGAPVADGTYSVVFKIWDDATSVNPLDLVWNSGSVSVSTVNGAFSVVLGSSPMPGIDPVDMQDSLRWLGITVGADPELTPRTRMTSVPYALTAERAYSAIEAGTAPNYLPLAGGTMTGPTVNSATFTQWHNGTDTTIEINPNGYFFRAFGLDQLEQIRLWGLSWGELMLWDNVGNDQTVVLTANSNEGGQLFLRQEDGGSGATLTAGNGPLGASLNLQEADGSLGISLNAELLGDAAVLLRPSSVSSGELLDEPGIASIFPQDTTSASGVDIIIDSVMLTVPASGYVVVTATGFMQLLHVTGTTTVGRMWINTSPTLNFSNFTITSKAASEPTATGSSDGFCSAALTKVEAVTAGTKKYYLVGDRFSGAVGSSVIFGRMRLTAMYFPTAYGTVESTIEPIPGDGELSPVGGHSSGIGTSITAEAHNASVVAELQRQRSELETRLAKLEAEMQAVRVQQGMNIDKK